MPISIKNEEIEKKVRKLTEFTGETITEAIGIAVSERFERVRRERSGRTLADELNAIALRCSKLPEISPLSAEEILGYDERGIPTR